MQGSAASLRSDPAGAPVPRSTGTPQLAQLLFAPHLEISPYATRIVRGPSRGRYAIAPHCCLISEVWQCSSAMGDRGIGSNDFFGILPDHKHRPRGVVCHGVTRVEHPWSRKSSGSFLLTTIHSSEELPWTIKEMKRLPTIRCITTPSFPSIQ